MLLALQLNMLLEAEAEEVAPSITTVSLANGNVGTPYNRTVSATGDAPITWSVTVGVLPDGLSINSGTGAITGTPTTEEVQVFTVQAENGAGTDTQELSITIGAAHPEIAGSPSMRAALRAVRMTRRVMEWL